MREPLTIGAAALQRRVIAEADAAFPGNPATAHILEPSHFSFPAMPGNVANIALTLTV